MTDVFPLIDLHCHLLPCLDCGARGWEDAVQMARMATADGISMVIATSHQLGPYEHIDADRIRRCTEQLQQRLHEREIPLALRPGATVRADDDLLRKLVRGDVLTLADRRRHLLIEMPADGERLVLGLTEQLRRGGITTIVARAERHPLLLRYPQRIAQLVAGGCLMQVTAGGLLGHFGPAAQHLSEWMLDQDLVHFVASDGQSPRSRRPLLRLAAQRVAQHTDLEVARRLCCDHPQAVVEGRRIELARRARSQRLVRWIRWRRAG